MNYKRHSGECADRYLESSFGHKLLPFGGEHPSGREQGFEPSHHGLNGDRERQGLHSLFAQRFTSFLQTKKGFKWLSDSGGMFKELSYKWKSAPMHCEAYFITIQFKELHEIILLCGETNFTLGLGWVNCFLFWHTNAPQTCPAWALWGCTARIWHCRKASEDHGDFQQLRLMAGAELI